MAILQVVIALLKDLLKSIQVYNSLSRSEALGLTIGGGYNVIRLSGSGTALNFNSFNFYFLIVFVEIPYFLDTS